ncbi:tyrosine-type recombinase/integrase [Muribaculum intestinale]|uniref:tyrosine-type recombinase/integrase n=1 Tax=Muribaculum intestinale TaxID=1796646 RepID=UPI0025B73DBD|nr:site-specific integrase [Muribaculum intestinale]
MKFSELYEKWHAEKILEIKPSTKALHAMHWRMLSAAIAEKDISDFGRTEAKLLLYEMLEAGLSPKTAKDRMAFVKQMLLFAATTLEAKIKPTDWRLKYPQGTPREIKSFTEAEMLRIVRYAEEEIKTGRVSVLPVAMSIMTGMRIGETLALRWGDIDWTHNIIIVRRNVVKAYDPETKTERYFVGSPKTKQGYREIPMLPVLRRILREIGGKTPDIGNYVVGNSGNPTGHGSVRDSYSRFLKRHRLPSINFHGLRHTYATLLVASGGDVKTISTLLGHSKVSLTLDLYVHPTLESKRKTMNKAFRKLRIYDADAPADFTPKTEKD